MICLTSLYYMFLRVNDNSRCKVHTFPALSQHRTLIAAFLKQWGAMPEGERVTPGSMLSLLY